MWLNSKGCGGRDSPDKKISGLSQARSDTMGFKKTSETLVISNSITETAANTFTQETINLPLDPLNNEVFVVLAIDIDVSVPSNVAAAVTSVNGSISTTSQTGVLTIGNTRCLARGMKAIAQGAGTVDGAAFQEVDGNNPAAQLDYIGIIATDDFFLQVEGLNNTSAKSMNARMWGYRAKADASTYAALVQSELLS